MATSRNRENKDFEPAPWFLTDNKTLWNWITSRLGDAVDDLNDVIDWLREDGQYEQADRLRTITGRIARLQRPEFRLKDTAPLIRDIARGFK
jgi:hypothetical protein